MAEIYGRLTGRAGVCSATLGPGAINLLLGTADAMTNSAPMVALAAQGSLRRIHKESHQVIDLVSMFAPVTQWSARIECPDAVPEMTRKAFKIAQSERPGAVFLAVPEDIEADRPAEPLAPLQIDTVRADPPSLTQIARATEVLTDARHPIVPAGHGAARAGASAALARFAEQLKVPVATTFHGKGVFPDDHPNALGAVGFMRHDYGNFGFDAADVLICVGYEIQEFDPAKINPNSDKRILHVHRFPAEVDAHYPVTVGVEGDPSQALDALAAALPEGLTFDSGSSAKIRTLLDEELRYGRDNDAFPLVPQRVVHDVRTALDRQDIVLADTGAGKMWMSRLYPTYEPDTCLVSNGLSTTGFALPGAIAAKLARPDRRVLAMMGDGSFLMNSQELETAVRERVPLVVFIRCDRSTFLDYNSVEQHVAPRSAWQQRTTRVPQEPAEHQGLRTSLQGRRSPRPNSTHPSASRRPATSSRNSRPALARRSPAHRAPAPRGAAHSWSGGAGGHPMRVRRTGTLPPALDTPAMTAAATGPR